MQIKTGTGPVILIRSGIPPVPLSQFFREGSILVHYANPIGTDFRGWSGSVAGNLNSVHMTDSDYPYWNAPR